MSHPERPHKRVRIVTQDAELQDPGPKSKNVEGVETVPPSETPGRKATPPSSSRKTPTPKVSSPVVREPTSDPSAVLSVSAPPAPTSKLTPALPPCAASPPRPPPPPSITQNGNFSKIGPPVFSSSSKDSRPVPAPQMSMQRTSNAPIIPAQLSPTEGMVKVSDELSPDEKIMFKSLSRVLGKKKDVETGTWKCTVCKQEKMSQPVSFGEDTPVGVVTQHVKIIHRQFWKELKAANPAETSNLLADPPP
ncbi:hypothetical protein BU17DRAFT_80345 [Hysterangium stoloniferum]|nr:hypothetical protein BU17DRAFT_80345 [Hysterangium stoloniferum]